MQRMQRFWTGYPLDPQGKPKNRRRFLLGMTCLGLFCAACCLGVLGMLYGSLYFTRARLLSYFQEPLLALLNILPVVLLAFFLYALTNRAWLAFLLTAALVMTAAVANYYKVIFRDDYLVFEDLKLIGAAAGIAGNYEIRLDGWFRAGVAACLLGTALLFFVCRGRLPGWRWRLGGTAVILALAVGSYALWYADNALYKSFENYAQFNRWKPTERTASRGLVYSFVHSANELMPKAPAGYSRQAAQALLEQYPEADLEEPVDVIAVMLESFSDFSALDGVALAADPYGALRGIWAESECGTLIVDTMGGSTVNSERSFLTGYTYPHPSYRHATESFARYFQRQGYQTEGAHPGHDWYYNRQNVNANLGLEPYYFMENYFRQFTDDEYAMDDVFFPGIQALYDARDRERPYFAFHVSYQNHSPYDGETLQGGTEYVKRDGLSEAAYCTVNNYLAGIADTAAQIAAFTENLRERAEPVVLVFFGDHKPTLGAGNCFYTELGVDLDRSTGEGFRNYYSTPYWIWMNDAAKETLQTDPAGTGPDISPCYLMTEVFDACGWQGPSYLAFLREAREALPVIHAEEVYWEQGVFTSEISENSQILLEKLQSLQYYLRRTTYK